VGKKLSGSQKPRRSRCSPLHATPISRGWAMRSLPYNRFLGRDRSGYRQTARRRALPPRKPRPQATPGSLHAVSIPTSSYAPCGGLEREFRTAARSVSSLAPVSDLREPALSQPPTVLGTGDGERADSLQAILPSDADGGAGAARSPGQHTPEAKRPTGPPTCGGTPT
jgi:hypothetical protein